jgi:hypothetical protein
MNFCFDTDDSHALAQHLPELRAALSAKQAERDRVREDIRDLEELILIGEGLSRRNGRSLLAKSEPPRRRRASPAQDRAVEALKQASTALSGTAVGPTSLYKYMVKHGLDAPKDATVLGTNLWDAWRAGRIRRAPNGVYLPLDKTGRTDIDRPLTDYYYAIEQGMSGPARPGRRTRQTRPIRPRSPHNHSSGT